MDILLALSKNVLKALEITWKGAVAIFIVIAIIILVTTILNKISNKKDSKKEE